MDHQGMVNAVREHFYTLSWQFLAKINAVLYNNPAINSPS